MKKYLVSYTFKAKEGQGFGNMTIEAEGSIKTVECLKDVRETIEKDVGGKTIILNIVELDG